VTPPNPIPREDLLARLMGPGDWEVTCEECFEALDRYVELELERDEGAADRAVPGMREHLEGCPACREDHDSLLTYVVRPRREAG